MNVIGLREAFDTAEEVVLPGGLSVKVPSIPALALLKIFAWRDRRSSEKRDAIDLATIVRWYSAGSCLDRLYAERPEILERFEYDAESAGAWLPGSHMRLLLEGDAAEALLRIAGDEDLMGRLVRDMTVGRYSTKVESAMVDALCSGMQEGDDR